MCTLDRLIIRHFEPKDQPFVRKLILSGHKERWGLLDRSMNADLDDISISYHDGIFLVALLNDEIVGTGAFIPEDNNSCRFVRMSTRINHRNHGIGTEILNKLIGYARTDGYDFVVLETTASWEDAVTFYLNRGFHSQGVKNGDHHFIKTIRE